MNAVPDPAEASTPTRNGAFERLLSFVRSRAFPPVILFAVVFVYFWPFFLKGEVIAPSDLLLGYPPWSSLAEEGFLPKNSLRSDIVDGYIPMLKEMREGVREGDIPLWSPERSQGRPLGTRVDSSFFHPLVLPLITLLPLTLGFSLLMVAKLYLAGLFMYLFLRRVELSKAAALYGAIAYMFCGYHIVWLSWPVGMVTAFAPLLFLMTENLVRRPSALNTGLLAAVVGLMVLGGFPSVTGYFFYAVGLYLVFRVSLLWWRERDWWPAMQRSALFGASVVLGIGLSAFVLLPSLETADFIDLSYREGLASFHFPIKSSIQLIFPNFYGNQVFWNRQGPGVLNETSGYVGIASLGLAMFGCGHALLTRRVWPLFFASVALFSVSLIYGVGPFLGWVNHLPIFDLNSSTRTLSVFGFSAAALSAYGVDALRGYRPAENTRTWQLVAAGLGLALLVAMLVYVGLEVLERRDIVRQFIEDFPVAEFHTFRLLTVGFGLTVVLLFSMAVFWHFRRPIAWLPAAALILLAVDLLAFGFRQNPTVPESQFFPDTPGIEYLRAESGREDRIAAFNYAFLIPGTQLYYGFNTSFGHELYSDEHRQMILALSPGAFRSSTSIIASAADSNLSSPLVDLLGMRFLATPPNLDLFEIDVGLREHFELVYEGSDLRIYENSDFVPARLVSSVEQAGDPADVLTRLWAADFDPDKLAFVEGELPADATGGSVADGAVAVTITNYDNERMEYRVDASSRALLLTPELDYPGWKAEIDGESAEIFRANNIFRSVFVPEGEHTVVFTYGPGSFRRGLIVSAVSLAIVVGLIGYGFWRNRRYADAGHYADDDPTSEPSASADHARLVTHSMW